MTYYYILGQKKEKETIFILLLKGMFNDQTECQKNKNCLLYCYYNYLHYVKRSSLATLSRPAEVRSGTSTDDFIQLIIVLCST